jgi:hypothetical protein
MIDLDLDTTISRGFSAGNYGAAYDGLDLEASLEKAQVEHGIAGTPQAYSVAFRTAFILGYLSSYELSEMGSDADAYLEAYHSEVGARCLAAGYIDAHEDQDVFPPGA